MFTKGSVTFLVIGHGLNGLDTGLHRFYEFRGDWAYIGHRLNGLDTDWHIFYEFLRGLGYELNGLDRYFMVFYL